MATNCKIPLEYLSNEKAVFSLRGILEPAPLGRYKGANFA